METLSAADREEILATFFDKEFRDGDVRLANGEVASVRRFIERARDFAVADIEAMVAEQFKIMRAIVPIHRAL